VVVSGERENLFGEEFASGSPFAESLLTRLWRGADGRETGADAVEDMRERNRQELTCLPQYREKGILVAIQTKQRASETSS
jgi:hypothetical protein